MVNSNKLLTFSKQPWPSLKSYLWITSDLADKIHKESKYVNSLINYNTKPSNLSDDLGVFVDLLLYDVVKECPDDLMQRPSKLKDKPTINQSVHGLAVLAAYGGLNNDGKMFYHCDNKEFLVQDWIHKLDRLNQCAGLIIQLYHPEENCVVRRDHTLVSNNTPLLVPEMISPFKMPGAKAEAGEKSYTYLEPAISMNK